MRKKQANKLAEPTTEEPMKQGDKLKEMIQSVLSKPLNEKKKSFPDLTGDGKVTKADILKARGVELDEDLDLGHEDNEPHMIKAELAQIGKYAMELYKMVDQFEGPQEVDFPAWWQSKITTAKNMISSAKHYLEFELEEPKIDAMVGVASEEGAIDESALDDRQYRDSNNIMRGVEDLAKNSKDVESYKEKWYKTYSQGPQDKDPETDKWLEGIYARMMKKGAIDEMSKKQIKKRGEIFDTLTAKGMPDKKAGKIATSTAMKKKIKEAILAKLK
jgi:hypothetical protein